METTLNGLAEQALGLPTNARAWLAELLLESLDFEEDFNVSPAWQEEIKRRCNAIDNKEVVLIPAQEALAALRAQFFGKNVFKILSVRDRNK